MFFFKFVRQEAVGIYYIPWPPKKIAAQISYQGRLPKTAQICAACTANWPKIPYNTHNLTLNLLNKHYIPPEALHLVFNFLGVFNLSL